MSLRVWIAAALLALPAGAGSVTLWRLEPGETTPEGAPDQPVAVGSLLKPFLAEAWARAHPGEAAPRFTCGPGDHCWLRAGHGELGLAGALAVSCNSYFLQLAAATPRAVLDETLAAEGFPPIHSVPQALGLGAGAALAVRPSVLLRAYVRLVREPWAGPEVRREVLAGLREAALTGTAAAMGHRGFWAKTGTVPGPGGDPRSTGLALAVDDAGWAILVQLWPGRGAEAARALAAPIDQYRPWALRRPAAPGAAPEAAAGAASPGGPRPVVRVRLFELLQDRRYRVRNLGPDPVPCGDGFLGPSASRELPPGASAGPGLLALSGSGGLERRFQGEVSCVLRDGLPRLIARMSLRDYVGGVLAAELPGSRSALRLRLGAAVLRFLAQGPRYRDADVGDSTRSACFVGRKAEALSDPDWAAIVAEARRPGPSQWSSDDGGRPLSGREVWGGAAAAPLAAGTPSHPWTRTWSAAQVAQAFGAPVAAMAVGHEDGVWVLRVRSAGGSRSFSYDQAHRLLARVLGWGALPSPADTVEPVPGGFTAAGVGLGHRVGLSLK